MTFKTKIFLGIAAYAITGGLCAVAGYFSAKNKILNQSKGELVVEENGTDVPNLYLRFVKAEDLNAVRSADCVVCKVIKADTGPKIFRGVKREIGKA